MSQLPTLGRIVIFQPLSPNKPAVPAVIHTVHNATCVSLETFGPDKQFPTSVCQGEPGQAGAWSWPKIVHGDGVKVESPQATLEFKTGPAANTDEPFPGGR